MTCVVDASAVLCVLLGERGADTVAVRIKGAWISSVNLTEVLTRLIDLGSTPDDLDAVVPQLDLIVVPFDAELGRAAADLRRMTRAAGLSLGDRACLALGDRLQATVLTGDRKWSSLDLGIDVEQIR